MTNFILKYKEYSFPLLSVCDWFQDPKSVETQVLYIKWTSISI